MKKNIFIIVAGLSVLTSLKALGQVDIDQAGKMTIAAQTQDWDAGLRVRVATNNSVAYNLWSPVTNADVSFFHACGYLWCRLGGYFGSDSTMKRNITPIDSALNKVMALNGVRYQFNPACEEEQNEYDSIPGHGYRFGFIAQEVETVLPEVVKTMPDGKKSMTYTDIIAILVEALKQQQAEINILRQAMVEHGLIEVDN